MGQLFPFAGRSINDPVSGNVEGLYTHCKNLPKVMITNTAWEYWRGDAALTHIEPDGSADLEPLLNGRIYLFAGTHHINGVLRLTDRFMLTNEQLAYPLNTISFTPLIRAALINVLRWITEGVEPPDSRIPRISDESLTTRDAVIAKFASREEFEKLPVASELTRLNRYQFGPNIDRGVCEFPAELLEPYAAMVANVNEQLNEVAGIHLPEIKLGLGIHSGWNPRHQDHGAPSQTATFAGFSVFDDSLRSFGDQHACQREIKKVTDHLVESKLDLAEDRNLVIQNALLRLNLGLDSLTAKEQEQHP